MRRRKESGQNVPHSTVQITELSALVDYLCDTKGGQGSYYVPNALNRGVLYSLAFEELLSSWVHQFFLERDRTKKDAHLREMIEELVEPTPIEIAAAIKLLGGEADACEIALDVADAMRHQMYISEFNVDVVSAGNAVATKTQLWVALTLNNACQFATFQRRQSVARASDETWSSALARWVSNATAEAMACGALTDELQVQCSVTVSSDNENTNTLFIDLADVVVTGGPRLTPILNMLIEGAKHYGYLPYAMDRTRYGADQLYVPADAAGEVILPCDSERAAPPWRRETPHSVAR